MSGRITAGNRRCNRKCGSARPSENLSTIKKELTLEKQMETDEDNQRDGVYIVVVKEEPESLEDEYEEPEYPAYNHDQPFYLHIPEEIKIEYDEDCNSDSKNSKPGEDTGDGVADYDHDQNESWNNVVKDQDDSDYKVDEEDESSKDSDYSDDKPDNSNKGKRKRTDEILEKWICGSEPDEKKLLELMQAPPPPLPEPLPYYMDGNVFRCKYCNFNKPNEGPCIRHYRTKHGPRYVYCFACGTTLANPADLYRHETRNCRAPGIKVVCRLRKRLLKSQVWRKRCGRREGKLSGVIGKTVCSHCRLDCETIQQLRKHEQQVHMNIRPFRCHFCPAAYSIRRSLYSHLQTHSKEPRVCRYCGKSFIKKDSLFLHLRIHEEKRYKCTYCPMAFTYNRSLQRHEARHTGAPPPHPCKFCSSGFWRTDFLKTHMEKLHGYSIITQRKFRQMLSRMTTDEIEALKEGEGMTTLESKSQMSLKQQTDDGDLSGDEMLYEVKGSSAFKNICKITKITGATESRELKKSLNNSKSMMKKSIDAKSSSRKMSEVKKSVVGKKTSGMKKSVLNKN